MADTSTSRASAFSFTVDVEDYFQTEAMARVVTREQWDRMPSRVEQSTDRILEILSRSGAHGTFFFLGWVAQRYPKLVRRVADCGHEIACHSYWHRLVYKLSPEEFRDDTKLAKDVIQDACGREVVGYRAPCFSFTRGTEWAHEILAELGFRYSSSICPVKHDIYDNSTAPSSPHVVASGKLVELPIPTLPVAGVNTAAGGGGYLRLAPYWYTSWAVKRIHRVRKYMIVYVHPWELDPDQPRLPAESRSRFRQYTGLRSMAGKLDRLLRSFAFVPIVDLCPSEWGTPPDNSMSLNTALK